MKKLMILYAIPVLIQLVMIPFWLVKIDYRIIDVSTINICVSLLISIYLIIINIILKGYSFGLIKIHVIMIIAIVFTILLGYIGWSKLDMNTFLHPDGLTAGFNKFFLQFGGIMTVVSLIISYILKLVKK